MTNLRLGDTVKYAGEKNELFIFNGREIRVTAAKGPLIAKIKYDYENYGGTDFYISFRNQILEMGLNRALIPAKVLLTERRRNIFIKEKRYKRIIGI